MQGMHLTCAQLHPRASCTAGHSHCSDVARNGCRILCGRGCTLTSQTLSSTWTYNLVRYDKLTPLLVSGVQGLLKDKQALEMRAGRLEEALAMLLGRSVVPQ